MFHSGSVIPPIDQGFSVICILLVYVFWMSHTYSIKLSSSVEYPFQSVFLRLKRILNVEGCTTIAGFTCTQIGRCCVCGIGS